jgi:hypothetical protein
MPAGNMLLALFPYTDAEKMKRNEHNSIIRMTIHAIQVLTRLECGEYSLFSQMISVGSAAALILMSSPKSFI